MLKLKYLRQLGKKIRLRKTRNMQLQTQQIILTPSAYLYRMAPTKQQHLGSFLDLKPTCNIKPSISKKKLFQKLQRL